MRNLLAAGLALTVLYGCSSDETVYHPHFRPEDIQAAQKKDNAPTGNPQGSPSTTSAIVEKVGNVDYAKYGIPLYPAAKLNEKANLAFKSGDSGAKSIQVTLDSKDDPEVITRWYKDQINAEHAYVVTDKTLGALGTIKGKTRTGYPISITVARVETNSVIDITVSESANN